MTLTNSPALFALGGMVLYLLACAGLILGYGWAKRRWRQRQMEREMAHLLSGRSLPTLLANAPYRYDHFQGEDGYRIYDSHQTYLGHAATAFEAELWIVRRVVAEEQGRVGSRE